MEIKAKDIHPINRLGSGNFGRVFDGKLNHKHVVFKMLKHAIHTSVFWNEIKIMKMMDHPNIPRLIGFCKDENFMCIVMEKCLGIDLLHLIELYEITEDIKIKITLQIINTLEYIHSLGILYRDLKPENIIVDLNTFDIRMIDFGISQVLSSPIKGMAGSLGYMAPEVMKYHFYTFSADMYSLGMTLFVLWMEITPKKNSIVFYHLQSIKNPYQKIIKQCLCHDPKKRPTFLQIHKIMDQNNKSICELLRYYFSCIYLWS